jgi:hypothetical protein
MEAQDVLTLCVKHNDGNYYAMVIAGKWKDFKASLTHHLI